MENVEEYINLIVTGAVTYGLRIIAAILVVIIGMKIVSRLSKIVKRMIERSALSSEVSGFLATLFDLVFKAFLILMVAGFLGIDTASLVAVLAAASFAVGLALQGSLSNFAAGILILLFKPYKVGNYVEIQEKFGKVTEIQIFNTIMETPGNKTLIIPNSKVIDGIISNISLKGNIRIEMSVTMPYSEDYEEVRAVIKRVLQSNPLILKDPLPEVGILEYDSHNIILAVRPFVLPEDYWEVQFQVYAQIKRAFHEAGISVAYSEGVEIGKIGK